MDSGSAFRPQEGSRSRRGWAQPVSRFPWVRVLGMTALTIGVGVLVFTLQKTNVSWLFSDSSGRFTWPDLPRFFVQKESSTNGTQETIYTVPSRQLTPSEVAQLQGTNQTVKPASPK